MVMLVSIVLVSAWLLGIYNLGYILAARVLGYTVSHASIGYGRTLHEFTLGTTTFKLCALPVGGGVTVKRHEITFRRLILICSGPVATILLAFFLAWLQLVIGFQRIIPGGAVVLESRATGLDLQLGDLIIEAADQSIQSGLDLSEKLAGWKSAELTLKVVRSGQVRHVKLTRASGTNGKGEPLGFVYSSLTETKRLGPIEALKKTPEAIVKLVAALMVTEGSLAPPNPFSAAPTFSGSLEFMVVGSLALGIFNLIPIPSLVGGDALVIAIELIRRRRRVGDIARAKGIAGICGVVIAAILIGFGICVIPSMFFEGLWILLLGLFFLSKAADVTRTIFGGRLILVLTLLLGLGIPLIFLISRITGLSIPVTNADRVAQIVRWTELKRYWSA